MGEVNGTGIAASGFALPVLAIVQDGPHVQAGGVGLSERAEDRRRGQVVGLNQDARAGLADHTDDRVRAARRPWGEADGNLRRSRTDTGQHGREEGKDERVSGGSKASLGQSSRCARERTSVPACAQTHT
jgi:hypothetical protein